MEMLRFTLPQMVWLTCKVLVDLKLDSGPFGNISARIPDTQTFWINPNGITFDQLKVTDILQVDLTGKVLSGPHAAHPGEFIHREIYRSRPDVQAIVHTHSENTVAHSLLASVIEPFTQLGAAIYGEQAIYHGFTGPVRSSDEGAAIADALNNENAIVIAKNHGLFTVNKNLPAALWDFVIADQAAKIHLTAKQLGLSHADALPEIYLHKSKHEVREKQYAFMWKSYIKKYHNVFTEPEIHNDAYSN